MQRTNIYLSAAQQAALDALATARGQSRSEVLRGVLDRGLNLEGDPALDEALADAAGELAGIGRALADSDPDQRAV